jgi:hypothetical protein
MASKRVRSSSADSAVCEQPLRGAVGSRRKTVPFPSKMCGVWRRNAIHYTLSPLDCEYIESQCAMIARGSLTVLQRVAGEVAFARMLGLTRPRASAQHRFVLPTGRTVDVYTPLRNDGKVKLMVPAVATLESAPTLYALVMGSWLSGEYRLVGFMAAEVLLTPERLGNSVTPPPPWARRLSSSPKHATPPAFMSYKASRSELLKPRGVLEFEL